MQMMRFAAQASYFRVIASLVSPGLAVHVALEREPVSLLRGRVATALESFAVAEADSEAGMDLGLDLGLVQDSSQRTSEPATLAEYCAGAPEVKVGTKVQAEWKDYGTMYPGKIKEKNDDGTVDIKYDDGFTEKNVDSDHFKVVDKSKQKSEEQAKSLLQKPLNDPACKLQEFLKKLQDQLKELNKMIAQWVSAQRAKIASEEALPPPPKAAKPAPKKEGTATTALDHPNEDQATQLEKLKQQLSDLDAYIEELEAEEAKYDKKLAKHSPSAAPDAADGVKTVDDLINKYKGKIAERNARVQELLQRIKEQKEELVRLGESLLSLKDIDEAVKKLEEGVEEGKRKRDELEKSGELDSELGVVIDSIIDALSKTRAKVDNLLALEAKAKAEKAKAEQEAKDAAEAARKKAKEEGKNADEAAAEAAAAAKKRTEGMLRKADMDTMEAAQAVEKDLEDAEKGATKLDTGLHPHGERWWRYRYEHSYIEAIIMVFISVLMLAWSEFWHRAKHYVNQKAEKPLTGLEELEEETHGGIYVAWLHWLADQMLVCIFVFLTIWLMAQTPLIEIFPLVIRPSEDMHVPHGPYAASEYKHLALDICTIFFFAIVFYFGLMFSVANEMGHTMAEIEQIEKDFNGANSGRASKRRASVGLKVSKHAMGSICDSTAHFERMQKNFGTVMNQQAVVHKDDEMLRDISRLLGDDFTNFPLAKYFAMSVRAQGVELFKFSWSMWLPTMGLFMVLLCLHRFAHMGYLRVMMIASLTVLVMIICMAYYTKTIIRSLHDEDSSAASVEETTLREKWSTESIVLGFLQFSLFFVCYGVARMICQPWMWELHFWPVLVLTIVALVSALFFVVIVAPGIPSFICAMAMPQNQLDPDNLLMMKQCALGLQRSPAASPRPHEKRQASSASFGDSD